MPIQKAVAKYKVGEQPSEYSFWQTQSYESRLMALEQIRQKYHNWTLNTRPRFQKIYKIVKRK